MYARVVTVMIKHGKKAEGIQLFNEVLIPSARQQPGFKGARLLTDERTGKALLVTIWESEADLIASETSGYFSEQVAKFAPLFASAPVREVYELSVSV
jgi:quinol monooxygenase YgiN